LTIRTVALSIALVIAATGARAEDDLVAAGKALSAPCTTCHGADGMALMSAYPNLAGQNEQYLVNALNAYRDGQRQGGMAGLMIPMAKALTDENIAALAKYYASLEP
jgi:cytochrome c553